MRTKGGCGSDFLFDRETSEVFMDNSQQIG